MALIDKVGIGLVPSGYKDSELYSAIPNNADADFNFTRASNATRVNSKGIIETVGNNIPRLNHDFDSDGNVEFQPHLLLEPSRTNELTYSEDLDQWTSAGGGSITTGATTSPKGTNDAFKLETDGSNNFGRIEQTVSLSSGNNVVLSVFVKKSGSDDVFTLRLEGTGLGTEGTGLKVMYDFTFSTETLTKQLGGTATSTFVENYGNDWYRIGMEVANTTVTKALFYPSFGSTDLGEVFIWGAQLEEGTFKTTYIETGATTVTRSSETCGDASSDLVFSRASSATRVNSQGLIETVGVDVLRLNFTVDSNDVVSSVGQQLIESAATNTSTRSNDFVRANGGRIFTSSQDPIPKFLTLTTNVATSPDGTTNAHKITADTTFQNHEIRYGNATVVANETNVLSIFAKKGTGADYLQLSITGFDTLYRANFNLDTGTIGATQNVTSPKMEYFGNGWYRCSVHFKTTTDVVGIVNFGLTPNNDFNKWTPSGTEHIFVYGLQTESTTDDSVVFPTSYIPTSGTAVTRAADLFTGGGGLFNDAEGVLFVEIASLVNTQDGTKEITINDSTANNRFSIRYSTVTNSISYLIQIGGVNIAGRSYVSSDVKVFSKVALKYKSEDIALWVDGVERKTDTDTFTVSGLSQIDFRRSGAGGQDFEGKVRQLMYFNELLSDKELEQLTTL